MLMIFELMKTVVKVKNVTLFIITIIFLIGSSYIVHWIEPDVFATPFIGFWYVMTTVTTTGYGDFVPQTVPGRIYGLFLYFFGIGLIGIVIGKIVDSFGMYRQLKEEGKLRYKGNGHYIIVSWSNKAKHTMNEILDMDEKAKIVLIDFYEKSPIEQDRIFYIQGDATDKEILEKANVTEASAVLIFAKDNVIDPVSSDGKSLIFASSIESYASEMGKDIYTIVEIMKEKHIPNFQHANVDEFILADEALSDLMAKSAVNKGSGKLVMKLLSRKSGVDLWKIDKMKPWKTYNDAFEDLKKRGANLISDRNDFNLLSKLEMPIPDEAELYIICNKETYKNIVQTQ